MTLTSPPVASPISTQWVALYITVYTIHIWRKTTVASSVLMTTTICAQIWTLLITVRAVISILADVTCPCVYFTSTITATRACLTTLVTRLTGRAESRVRTRDALWRTHRLFITLSGFHITWFAVTVTDKGTSWPVSSNRTHRTLNNIDAVLTGSHTRVFTTCSIMAFNTLAWSVCRRTCVIHTVCRTTLNTKASIVTRSTRAVAVIDVTTRSYTTSTTRAVTRFPPVPRRALVTTVAVWTRVEAKVCTSYAVSTRPEVAILAAVTRVSWA